MNAPADLALYVDPQHVGCGLAIASTTTTTTSALPPRVTTTSVPVDDCGSPVSGPGGPTPEDCLLILTVALNMGRCDPACLCAPAGSLPTTTVDALACLQRVVRFETTFDCPCEIPSTISTRQPGLTKTTRAAADTTTISTLTTSITTTSTSTTTTLAAGPDPNAGRDLYNRRCAGCHSAGGDDTSGFAGDLAGTGNRLVPNLGSLDGAMSGLTLTDEEIADLAAYLDSL